MTFRTPKSYRHGLWSVVVSLALIAGTAGLLFWIMGCVHVAYDDDGLVDHVDVLGRGCVDIWQDRQMGQSWTTIQGDASTDPASIRALPAIAREAVLAIVGAPSDALRALVGSPAQVVPGPSEIHGCEGLFELEAGEPVLEDAKPGLVDRLRGWFKKEN